MSFYLLYTDETNFSEREGVDFLFYGGVMIEIEKAPKISLDISEIKKKYGYTSDHELKFNSSSRKPEKLSSQDFAICKSEIINIAAKHEVKILISVINRSLMTDEIMARELEINRVARNFNVYLRHKSSYGMMQLDSFEERDIRRIIRNKFTKGLEYRKDDGSIQYEELSRIIGFHVSFINSSNFSSLVDVLLGTVAYCANIRNNPTRQSTVSKIMPSINSLFLRRQNGKVSRISIFYSPVSFTTQARMEDYIDLNLFFEKHGINVDWEPRLRQKP